MEDGAHDDIAALEARIEVLAESIEQCRTIALASKLTIAAGAAWLGLMLFGVTPSHPAGLVISLAASIGGIVLLGSNSSTWKEREVARRAAETIRTELIEQLELRVVGERRRLH